MILRSLLFAFLLSLCLLSTFVSAHNLDPIIQRRQNSSSDSGLSSSPLFPSPTGGSGNFPTSFSSRSESSQVSSQPFLTTSHTSRPPETSAQAPASTPVQSSSSTPVTDSSSRAGSTDSFSFSSSAPTSSEPGLSSSSNPVDTSSRAAVTRVTSIPLVSSETRQISTNIVTVVGGRTSTVPTTTDSVIAHTTGFTTPAGLSSGGGSSSNGLSDSSKKIVGGVVGGIGGAVLIGGILVVLYRLRKKKRAQQDDDDLMSQKRSSHMSYGEQSSSGLERYSTPTPNTTVNAASNF